MGDWRKSLAKCVSHLRARIGLSTSPSPPPVGPPSASLPRDAASKASGEEGERLAAQFLQKRGFKIIVRNWRSPLDRRDELDLVCRDGAVLVFVEVKARSARALVSGYHSIDKRKKTVLRRAATTYLRRLARGERPATFRLDVVEVEFAAAGEAAAPIVRHFENVPLFPKHFQV